MKVSVAIATYNRARYIRQAIESVLNQTMTDFEVIVVDDGSTDNTVDVIADYRDRIRFVRTENGGPARARNMGMAMARGEYICWLDSDDLFHPAKLAVQVAVLDARPELGMVWTDCTAFDDQGMWQEYHLQDYHESAYRRGGITYDGLYERKHPISAIHGALKTLGPDSPWRQGSLYSGKIFNSYLTDTIVFTNSMLFRTSLYEAIGPQRPRFGLFHDLEFALRLCKQGPVGFLDVPSYAIRYHADQISTMVGPRAPWILIRKQQGLLRVLRAHGLRDAATYAMHAARIDRQVARLCRAVAVPMLGYDSGSRHRRRSLPRRARTYLGFAAARGYPQWLLMAASWLPHALRRALMKLESIFHRWLPGSPA